MLIFVVDLPPRKNREEKDESCDADIADAAVTVVFAVFGERFLHKKQAKRTDQELPASNLVVALPEDESQEQQNDPGEYGVEDVLDSKVNRLLEKKGERGAVERDGKALGWGMGCF